MKRFLQKNGFLVLFIATVAAVTLCAVNFFSTNTSPLSNFVNTILTPIRSGYTAVADWVEYQRAHFTDVHEMEARIEELEIQLAETERKLRQAEADSEENRLLRELLNLRQQQRDFVYESAKIIEHGSSNWESSLTLNRGTKHGVEMGDCVISSTGYLVGIVSELGDNWCKVLTVLDTEFSMGAMDFRTEEVCVAEGDFHLMPGGKLTARYVDTNSDMAVGDLIVTSGFGGYYPQGIVIGTVEAVQVDDSGLSLTATLRPRAQISDLTQAFIIKDFTVVD
ncbi:MAG: rod shape-determining protein MreC [Oscillospiraceae bacterium]|nr:rod shape-determining protein MreC [Oscillospiraceae bacterium]